MPSLKTYHVKKINAVLMQKGLLDVIHNYLKENELDEFDVQSVKLKLKPNKSGAVVNAVGCYDVCTMAGVCTRVCP